MQVYILAGEEFVRANTSYNIYDILGVIDEAESVLWQKRYNDAGEAEIYIPCSSAYLSMLCRGNYVFRYDDDMFCKIGKVEIETNAEEGDHIIATSYDIFNILAGRIVRWKIVFSGTVGEFIKKVLTENVINPAQGHRAIENFVFYDRNIAEFSEKIEVSTFTEDLSKRILDTCKAYNIGIRVSFNMETRKLVCRLYRGKNKASIKGGEYIEFSPDFANIIDSKYVEDDTAYKNVVYVGYKSANKDDDTVYLYSYPDNEYSITGEHRHEMYVDASSVSREIKFDELMTMFSDVRKEGNGYVATINGTLTAVALSDTSGSEEKITVTDDTYMLLIRAVAVNALATQTKKQTFEGVVDTIDTYKYKSDYELGDIVLVKNEYGIEAAAQITEIMESEDSEDGYAVEPQFEYLN